MRSAIKCYGGKAYLADTIVGLMPPHIHYVEPFFGSGAVLFARSGEGVSEVVNDLDTRLAVFWSVLANPSTFFMFQRRIACTPFSEAHFQAALAHDFGQGDPVADAVAFFTLARQSFGAGQKTWSPLSKARTRRGMNEQVSAWLGAIEHLPEVHERLRRVAIMNKTAVDCILSQDSPGTLFYCDPPYLAETRVADQVYAHEMSAGEHLSLLHVLRQCKGKVILSGYQSVLYDQTLSGWRRIDLDVPNCAAKADTKGRKTECLWLNE